MNLEKIEQLFQNAWAGMDKKKVIMVFFSLCICGVLAVFSRVISISANRWAGLSLAFAPIFIIGGLLFALGVVLIKSYRYEKEGSPRSYLKIATDSIKTLLSVSYLTLPMLLLSLLSWLILGVFFLLKEIPGIGEYVGVFLSFAPFVLILSTLFLVFFNAVLLFFITPELSTDREIGVAFFKTILKRATKNPLVSLMGFVVASTPIFFILSFLILAAVLTQKSYLTSINPILIGLKWFFLMLPFNALLTPAIIFFFNFSFEVDQMLLENAEPNQDSTT